MRRRPFPPLLPDTASVPRHLQARLEADFERFRDELPPDLRAHCLESYGIDIAGSYAGQVTRCPFGKASGQLSLNTSQVRKDAEAGLGFVVLKTVIAEDAVGERTMSEWAIPETRMRVERIDGPEDEAGWTVTWKGRGWHESFDRYCELFRQALEIGGERGMGVSPSVKYHLPASEGEEFRGAEYEYTTRRLQAVWSESHLGPMPLEKDFSPTLAGDSRSRDREQILEWLRRVPDLIRRGAQPPGVHLGVKLMNARFDADFQVEMFRTAVEDPYEPPDFLIYANRLFDPIREFEGKTGVAYGGPELSRRNLDVLRRVAGAYLRDELRRIPPISATGDILTGRTAVQYGLLGAVNCQLHTVFQLPDGEFAGRMRNKSAAVLHHLVLHPETGLVAWLLHLSEEWNRKISWLELPAVGNKLVRITDLRERK